MIEFGIFNINLMESLIKDFSPDRLQWIVLNGQVFSGPLFFIILTNDLPSNMDSRVKIFADDNSMCSTIDDP